MHPFEQIFEAIRGAENYREKCQLMQYLYQITEQRKNTLDEGDRHALTEFALAEVVGLPAIIEATEDVAVRDDVCTYADFLPAFVMLSYPTAKDLPEEDYARMNALHDVLMRERFLENAVDEAFEEQIPSEEDIDRLLCVVVPLKEEYRKGKFFVGLDHYRDKVGKLDADAKAKLAGYTASELRRYLAMENFDKIVSDALEMIVDVCALYLTDELAALVAEIMPRVENRILFFALQTLLRAKKPVPGEAEIIGRLARDLVHADGLHRLLCEVGKVALFPAELNNPAYLAKSDMVHWLTYPTELGQVPDEIEYLGQVKKGFFKREKYHIFRFKSMSDNLDAGCKGRWLIGWSNDEGGTFSNFDLYDDYVGKTPEATLTNIKRKLL